MKKIIVAGIALLAISVSASAQCGKKVNWIASGFDMVDSSGNISKTKTAAVLIEQTPETIRFSYDGDPNSVMEGPVQNVVCNWKEAYKAGKTTFTADMVDPRGESKHAKFVIEAVDGKIVITGAADERPNQILRIKVDRYEEK